MKKEPWFLYLFRLFLMLLFVGLMGMLYWSSLVVEEEVISFRQELHSLKKDLQSLKGNLQKVRNGSYLLNSQQVERPYIDSSLPNLLEEDPFYEKTLPALLGENFSPKGTFHQATIGKPQDLHPFSNWSEVSGWRGMCTAALSRLKFGQYETMSPNLAIKIEERENFENGGVEYWVHLRDQVYWQPLSQSMFSSSIVLAEQFKRKHQVTAEDFKLYFDAMMNPHVEKPGAVSLRNYLGDIEEIRILDPLTFVVRWKASESIDNSGKRSLRQKYTAQELTGSLGPFPSFVYKYFPDGTKIIDDEDPEAYRTNSVWAQNFSEHWAKNVIVSCGPWIFEGMSDEQITFHRNPDHFYPLDALMERQIFTFKNTPEAIWQSFKRGDVDTYILPSNQLLELENFLNTEQYYQQKAEGKAIHKLEYRSRSYLYIGWNQKTPYFHSQKVRQAMTLAIDRNRMIQQALNGMGTILTGTFSPGSPSYDSSVSPWPYDPERAKQLLEEEGWIDRNGDGIRDKEINGVSTSFVFSLTYYFKNPTTKAICEYIVTSLKEIGIVCQLNGVDIADLSATFDERNFDALCLGWALGTPPEDPRQLWHSAGAEQPGSSNVVGFANTEADAIIEQLTFESDREERLRLYHRFHNIIHQEQPYTFLYTPRTIMLYRDYVKNVFIPAERQDLIPGANIEEPISSVFWIDKHNE